MNSTQGTGSFTFTVLGQPPSKSNGYKLRAFPTPTGPRASMYKSSALRKYEESFISQVPGPLRGVGLTGTLWLVIHCYYTSRRPDLDNSLKVILDCLQAARVIKNDNTVYRIECTKTIDKDNPRTEIELGVYQ